MQVDVVDVARLPIPLPSTPAPSPIVRRRRRGGVTTCDSHRCSRPRRAAESCPWGRLPTQVPTSANPAPSPMEMPLRSTSNGRHGSRDSSSSEPNPYSVVRQRLSTPPTTAASHRPAAIIRAAAPNAFALEEQAVETTDAGPSSPRCACTNASEGKGVLRAGIVEIARQRAGCGIAESISDLGLQDAGSARPQDHADAAGAVAGCAPAPPPARNRPPSDPAAPGDCCGNRRLASRPRTGASCSSGI